MKSGRTNDEVRTAPAASWSGQASWAGPTADELAALDGLGRAGTWSLGGHELHLTDLDAPVVPGRGRGRPLTKRDLVRHHAVMAPVVLPYLADRPVEAHRGARGAGRAIVEVPADAPDWLPRWRDRDADRGHPRQLVVPDSAAALVFLAELGAVELRPWISTVDDPQAPTWALFHIEPGRREGAATTLELARLHRTALAHLGVEGRPVLTGARAIQIWVPVAGGARSPGPGSGSTLSRRRSARPCRPRRPGVRRRAGRRSRPPRHGAERVRGSAGHPVRSPTHAGRARRGADRLGRARRRPAAR